MSVIETYVWCTVLVNGCLFGIWKMNNLINTLMKLALFGLMAGGIALQVRGLIP
jgi:hypothetical protein